MNINLEIKETRQPACVNKEPKESRQGHMEWPMEALEIEAKLRMAKRIQQGAIHEPSQGRVTWYRVRYAKCNPEDRMHMPSTYAVKPLTDKRSI
jgi:hypothetical protein